MCGMVAMCRYTSGAYCMCARRRSQGTWEGATSPTAPSPCSNVAWPVVGAVVVDDAEVARAGRRGARWVLRQVAGWATERDGDRRSMVSQSPNTLLILPTRINTSATHYGSNTPAFRRDNVLLLSACSSTTTRNTLRNPPRHRSCRQRVVASGPSKKIVAPWRQRSLHARSQPTA